MIELMTSSSRSELTEIERHILEAVKTVKFGSVAVIIHDGRIVQIERHQKLRFDPLGNIVGSGPF